MAGALLLVAVVAMSACSHPSSPATTAPAAKTEAPIAPESSPPGDIPDNQVFVSYAPPAGGFQVKIPEGWSRTTGAQQVSFTDKLNTVTMLWMHVPTAPTVAQVESTDVKRLAASLSAFQLVSVRRVTLPAGPAVHVMYRANGATNAVTGKRYRLDVERYIYFRNGKRVDLVLSSPVGADNVDPWRTISQSLKWL